MVALMSPAKSQMNEKNARKKWRRMVCRLRAEKWCSMGATRPAFWQVCADFLKCRRRAANTSWHRDHTAECIMDRRPLYRSSIGAYSNVNTYGVHPAMTEQRSENTEAMM